MPAKRKPKIDPIESKASYGFSLKDGYEWGGELVYSIDSKPIPSLFPGGLLSIPSININVLLSHTTSKKLKIGSAVSITIFMENGVPEEKIGYIEKRRQETSFSICLPWDIANHVHMILISNKAKEIFISGTELYRGSGVIHRMHVTRES